MVALQSRNNPERIASAASMYTRVAIPYLASVHQLIGPTSHLKWALLTASFGSIRVMQKLMPTDLKALSLTLSILQISIMLYKQSKP